MTASLYQSGSAGGSAAGMTAPGPWRTARSKSYARRGGPSGRGRSGTVVGRGGDEGGRPVGDPRAPVPGHGRLQVHEVPAEAPAGDGGERHPRRPRAGG